MFSRPRAGHAVERSAIFAEGSWLGDFVARVSSVAYGLGGRLLAEAVLPSKGFPKALSFSLRW